MGNLLFHDGWQAAAYNRSACGVFILDLNVAGNRVCVATKQLELQEFKDGPLLCCVSAITNSPTFSQSIDPYQRQFNISTVSFEVMAHYFPVWRTVGSGQSFGNIPAKLYWMISDCGFTLDEAFLLIDGTVDGFQFDEQADLVSFSVVGRDLSGDSQFPPHVVSLSSHDSAVVPAESFGKCYPVIVGTASKVPIIDVSDDMSKFLAIDDPFYQFTGTPVKHVYEGDTELTINGQAAAVDLEGNTYWKVDMTGDEPTGQDVTADIESDIPGNPIDAILYMLTAYSSKIDFFDTVSLRHLENEFRAITLSAVFNSIVEGGVMQAIKDRLIKELPLAITQRGQKYYFQALLWNRDVSKVLSTDKNIIQTTSQPTETDRSQMANSFTVRAGVSGLRGDALTAITRTRDNDALCMMSALRYGEIGRREIDVPDLADIYGATWLMNWSVQTYALKRVRVSYLCTFDEVDVNLWDTVQVFDSFHGWIHGPLFKVVGIHYGATNGIVLDLLSVDDYFDVYNVNRQSYAQLALLGAQPV